MEPPIDKTIFYVILLNSALRNVILNILGTFSRNYMVDSTRSTGWMCNEVG